MEFNMPPLGLEEDELVLFEPGDLLQSDAGLSKFEIADDVMDLEEDSVSNSEEIPFGPFKLVPLAFEKSQPRLPSRKPRIHESQLLPDETSLYLETIYQILEERSPQAEPKRQSGVIIVPSIHIPGIREQLDKRIPHIMKKMPNLTNNQIRYLFRAPRRNTTNAKRYWGIIDARVAFGDNSLHEDHELVNLNNLLIDF